MRANEVKDAIVKAIESIVPDFQATAEDTFSHVESGQNINDMTIIDRMFFVIIDTPSSRVPNNMVHDLFTVSFNILVMYVEGPSVVDRIAQDVERIHWELEGLTAKYADIGTIQLISEQIIDIEEKGAIVAPITIQINYRLTGLN